ncbi:MAG: hypothetical protein ACE5IZ_01915 [Dehalococcoidia bacterium]
MDFEAGWAVVAGLVGGAVMTGILYMGIFMMPNQMKMNLLLLLGTMMVPAGVVAYMMGAMMHAGASAIFGIIHGAVFSAGDITDAAAAWGLLFGLVHWAVAGMALGMMPMMHPRVRNGEMAAPGFYALNYPPLTAMGFLMLHLVYGVLVGALYEALAG